MITATIGSKDLTQIMEEGLLDTEVIDQCLLSHPLADSLIDKGDVESGVAVQDIVAIEEMVAHNYLAGQDYGTGVPNALKAVHFSLDHNFDIDVSLEKTSVRRASSPKALVRYVNAMRTLGVNGMFASLEKMCLGTSTMGYTSPMTSFPTIANVDRSYGSLDSTTYPAWDGLRFNANTGYGATSYSALVSSQLLYNLCEDVVGQASDFGKKESIDVIMCGQLIWDAFAAIGFGAYNPTTGADAQKWGANVANFKNNIIIVKNKHIPDSFGYMYFFNFDYLKIILNEGFNFEFTGYEEVSGSDKVEGHILLSGELVCTQPRRQALVTNLPITR